MEKRKVGFKKIEQNWIDFPSDTNILIYLYSEDEIEKQQISENLANQYSPIISIQVLNEICNVMIKKLNAEWTQAQ